jgi:hypothetical protein
MYIYLFIDVELEIEDLATSLGELAGERTLYI